MFACYVQGKLAIACCVQGKLEIASDCLLVSGPTQSTDTTLSSLDIAYSTRRSAGQSISFGQSGASAEAFSKNWYQCTTKSDMVALNAAAMSAPPSPENSSSVIVRLLIDCDGVLKVELRSHRTEWRIVYGEHRCNV